MQQVGVYELKNHQGNIALIRSRKQIYFCGMVTYEKGECFLDLGEKRFGPVNDGDDIYVNPGLSSSRSSQL